MKFNHYQIKIGKLLASITWLLAIVAFLLPTKMPLSSVFMGIGIFLIIAHLLEILIYRKRLQSINKIIGVFFFGILYMQQMALNKAEKNT